MCPQNFCTQYVGENNYIACCPSGYKFETTGKPIVATRPAYGGICYTDIPISQELTAVMYDSTGSAHQEVWAPSTTGAQGWAHPIDGWATSRPALGCAVKQSTTTSASESASGSSVSSTGTAGASARPLTSTVSSAKNKAKKASGGVIAGAVLGALAGLAAILGLILLLLRRKKRGEQSVAAGEQGSQSSDGVLYHEIHQKDTDSARVEASGVTATAELDSGKRADAHELGTRTERQYELPAGNGASQR